MFDARRSRREVNEQSADQFWVVNVPKGTPTIPIAEYLNAAL